MLTFFAGNTRLGRPLMLPPDVPAERVAALRRAFDATMRDAAFLKEAETMGFEVSPQTGRGDRGAGCGRARDPGGDRPQGRTGRHAGLNRRLRTPP